MGAESANNSGILKSELKTQDVEGRVITFRHLTALDRLRLFKAIGSILSENPSYLGMAMLAVSVTTIDSVPVPQPITEAQLEALIVRLGDAGLSAIADGLEAAQLPDVGLADAGN